MMVNHVAILFGQQFFGKRHADSVAEALSERPSGRLDARRNLHFRMTWRHAVQLAEIFDFRHGQVVAGHMQQRIRQHRPVAVGHHKPVTVWPMWISRVVPQMLCPQGHSDFCHAHWHALMTGFGLGDGIDREHSDSVGCDVQIGGGSWGGGHAGILKEVARRRRGQALNYR